MTSEVYISVDIETDGPIPGPHSMLSLGAAAFTLEKGLVSTFSENLVELPGAKMDPDTKNFWNMNPEAWEACRKNVRDPAMVMGRFVDWAFKFGKPAFVGYPAGFDFLFVYWYIRYFGFQSPFSFSAVDIKTYAMAMLKKPYRDSTKRNMPKRWFPKDKPHTHVALDDAIGQGELFMNMLRENIDVSDVSDSK